MGMLTDRHTAKRKRKKKKTQQQKNRGKKKSVCLCIGQWGILHRGACERKRETASRQRELPRLLASGTRPFSVVTTVNTIDEETTFTEDVIKDLSTVN
jgi:hypothetical protein